MVIEKVGIVGCGTMGAGIAQVALQAGYTVNVKEVEKDVLEKGMQQIKNGIDRVVQKGQMTVEEKEKILKKLTGTISFEDLKDCDIVIEAVFEDFEVKKEVFTVLDRFCKEDAIFASNTSSLSITRLASCTKRINRFIGLHFFNPVQVMPLVEVVKIIVTEKEVIEEAVNFVKSLNKHPIIAKDNVGFIVNLLLTPYLLDAIRIVGEGYASIEDIDAGMRLGCNYPMGPLMLADFIGLDILLSAANTFFNEYKEKRYAPPPLLVRMVTLGFLGRKTKRGFYDWTDPKNPVPNENIE